MKKILPLLLATMAASAFADETSASINTLGVLRVDSPLKSTIVAVPWVKLSGTGTDAALSVADYVKTENLTAGDHLYVYDASTEKYKVWVLANGAWTPTATVDDTTMQIDTAPDADKQNLPLASALWLERKNPTSGDPAVPVPFYLAGQVPLVAGTHPIMTGTADKPVWNLVANASDSAMSLASITGGGDADEIYLVNDDAAPSKYTKKNGVWGAYRYVERTPESGKYVRQFVAATDNLIAPGTGFWYVSKSSTPPVIP